MYTSMTMYYRYNYYIIKSNEDSVGTNILSQENKYMYNVHTWYTIIIKYKLI